MDLRRDEPGLVVRGRITWEELLHMMDWAIGDIDYTELSIRDAERLERSADFIRRMIAGREPRSTADQPAPTDNGG